MKIKPKICKQCGKAFYPLRITPVCSYVCVLKYNEEKEVLKRVKQMKKDLVSPKDLEKVAKRVFQKWVRLRDANLPCISCGTETSKQWDGGHYKKAEIYSGVIFNEFNVNKQCSYCNKHLHGNELNYRAGMIKKYGVGCVESLESLANRTRQYRYTTDELLEIIKMYKEKTKILLTK